MQAADAEDIAQEILVAVAKAVEQRRHDPKRANLTWLHRVANNIILDALTRKKPDRGGRWLVTASRPCSEGVARRAGFGPVAGNTRGRCSPGLAAGPQGIPPRDVERLLVYLYRRKIRRGRGEGTREGPWGDFTPRGAGSCGGSERKRPSTNRIPRSKRVRFSRPVKKLARDTR